MDIRNFNRKLQKIASLTSNSDDGSDLSALEYDLLLNYIRDLYDIAVDHSVAGNKSKSEPKSIAVETPQAKPVEVATPVQKVIPEIQQVAPPKPVEVAPVVQDLPPAPKPVIEEKPIEIPSIQTPMTTPNVSSGINPELLAELFVEERISDLSDKLASAPVKDLTKSMGINERIFTQQELFANNQQAFVGTLEKLNNCQNFDQAKQYLIENVISQYGWTNEQKLKKAATFIKLVKRKFT